MTVPPKGIRRAWSGLSPTTKILFVVALVGWGSITAGMWFNYIPERYYSLIATTLAPPAAFLGNVASTVYKETLGKRRPIPIIR
jgi:hypothetical protein